MSSFPSTESKWQISTEGGMNPVWGARDRELFFQALDSDSGGATMMVSAVETGPAFRSSKPESDLAINDRENLDIAASGPVFSMGFEFVEPSQGGSGTDHCFVGVCTDSSFTVNLKDGGTVVDSFLFNAPDDVAAFIGVWSSVAFDRLEIRETVGDIDDEFWGHVYTGTRQLSVPEPTTLLIFGLGLVGIGNAVRKKG